VAYGGIDQRPRVSRRERVCVRDAHSEENQSTQLNPGSGRFEQIGRTVCGKFWDEDSKGEQASELSRTLVF
jgi:hypothetical protein